MRAFFEAIGDMIYDMGEVLFWFVAAMVVVGTLTMLNRGLSSHETTMRRSAFPFHGYSNP
jgi:hypothetical protein